MLNQKKILLFLLLFCFIQNIIPNNFVRAYQEYSRNASHVYNNFKYSLDETSKTASIDGYNGTEKIINVPNKIIINGESYDVTSIGDSAFYGYTSPEAEIIIPEGVEYLYDASFYHCNVKKISLPNTLRNMCQSTFWGCILDELILPDSITGLWYVQFGDSKIKKLILSNNIKSIGYRELADSYIDYLKLPNNLEKIEPGAFDDNHISYIDIDKLNQYFESYNGILYTKDFSELPIIPSEMKGDISLKEGIPRCSLRNCKFSNVNLPDSLERLWVDNCPNLEKINIPKNIIYSAEEKIIPIANCSNLKYVTFPETIDYICQFSNCPNLKHIIIENKNATIPDNAFSDNSLPTNISILNTTNPSYSNPNLYKVVLKGDNYQETQYVKKGERLIFDSTKYNLYDNFGLVDSYFINKDSTYTLCPKELYPIKEFNNYTYSLNSINHTAKVVSYNGEDENIEIPSSIDIDDFNYKVTEIKKEAFSGSNISSIIIPEGVNVIGTEAFSSCANLKNVSLPQSLKRINSYAFYNCTNLEEILIPSNVKEICSYAFANCKNLKSFNLPEGIEQIGDNILSYSEIDTIKIPSSTFAISNNCFNNLYQLNNIEVDQNNSNFESVDGVLYNKNTKTVMTCIKNIENSITIKDYTENISSNAFADCKFTSINLPDTLNNIAIDSCNNLEDLTLPQNISSSSNISIKNCTNLKYLAISNDNFKTLESSSITNCPKLNNIYINSSNGELSSDFSDFCKVRLFISHIGTSYEYVKKGNKFILPSDNYYLFDENMEEVSDYNIDHDRDYDMYCKDDFYNYFLYSINSDNNTATITGYAGRNPDPKIPSEIVTDDKIYKVTNIESHAFYKSNISSIFIPEGVTNISSNAFYFCKNLEKVILPQSLKTIGYRAFSDCYNLKYINLPSNLSTIDSSAFESCEKLEEISIPSSVKSIKSQAFYKCRGLKTFTLTEGIQTIEDRIIDDTDVKSIYIPASACNISDYAFRYIRNLENITVNENNTNFESTDGILYNKNKKTLIACADKYSGNVVIKDGYPKIDRYLFQYCEFNNIKFSDDVEEITLRCCDNIKNLVLPKKVSSSSDFDIQNCDNLKCITLSSNSFGTLKASSLYNCPNLKCIIFNSNNAKLSSSLSDFNEGSLTNVQFVNTSCEYDDPSFYKVTLKNADKDLIQYVRKGSDLYIDTDKYDLYDENGLVDDYRITEDKSYTLVNKEDKNACDINKDNLIDIEDLSLVASKYNTTSEDENFEKLYDINNDGICDIYDIVKVSSLMY